MKKYIVYAVEHCCKIRVYRDRVEYLTPMQVFCLGLSGMEGPW